MRFFEASLILVNALTLVILVIPWLRRHGWTRFAPLAGLLAAILQVFVEGARWEMLPAYVLTAAFIVVGLLGLLLRRLRIKKWITVTGTVLGAIAGSIILMMAILLPVLIPVFHFPKPTGPYAVGTLTYHWTDTSRPELFTADPNDHRELMAQVWYPGTATKGQHAAYIDHADTWVKDTVHALGLPSLLLEHFKYVTTNAIEAAPIANDKPQFPVLIYQPGLDGFRSLSTFQIEELVSHGYIVVGLDQPGAVASVTFPDGKHIAGLPEAEIDPYINQAIWPQDRVPVLNGVALPNGITPYFSQDASFALDQLAILNASDPNTILTNHLDLDRVGTFGMSLGGTGVAEVCAKDSRFKACLIMDARIPQKTVQTGIRQPTMFITRDAATMRLEREKSGGWTEQDIASALDRMQSLYDKLPGNGYYVEIPNMFHVNFTDLPYWIVPSPQLGLAGPINGQRGFDIVNAYSVAFFDKELKGQRPSLLDSASMQYPEARLKAK